MCAPGTITLHSFMKRQWNNCLSTDSTYLSTPQPSNGSFSNGPALIGVHIGPQCLGDKWYWPVDEFICLLLREMTSQCISDVQCNTPQSLTFFIISFSMSEFPFSWYILLWNIQRHFQIHLKTNDICLFVVARDDISIYQRLPVRVHNSPFLWPSPSYLCRKYNNFKTSIVLICFSNIHATVFTILRSIPNETQFSG